MIANPGDGHGKLAFHTGATNVESAQKVPMLLTVIKKRVNSDSKGEPSHRPDCGDLLMASRPFSRASLLVLFSTVAVFACVSLQFTWVLWTPQPRSVSPCPVVFQRPHLLPSPMGIQFSISKPAADFFEKDGGRR